MLRMRIKTLEEWRHELSELLERVYGVIGGLSQSLRVYDCADLNVPMLARMFDRLCHHYEGIGYTIQLTGSAAPAVPADVPLPVVIVARQRNVNRRLYFV